MRNVLAVVALAMALGASGGRSPQGPADVRSPSTLLWYRQPAAQWDHAMPIGNGRLGAMVFGGVNRERIQLNENTLWMGGRQERDNPDALKHLPEVRRLLFAGAPAGGVRTRRALDDGAALSPAVLSNAG